MEKISINRRFIAELAKEDYLTVAQVARRSGLSRRDAARTASRLVSEGRISRVKNKPGYPGGYYRYFLTPEQIDRSLMTGKEYRKLSRMKAADIASRLSFLRKLENTIYGENATLKLIIQDYRDALATSRRGAE